MSFTVTAESSVSMKSMGYELGQLPVPLPALWSLRSVISILRLIVVPGRSRSDLRKSEVFMWKASLFVCLTILPFHEKNIWWVVGVGRRGRVSRISQRMEIC